MKRAALLIPLVVALTACGGDSALSRTDFVAQADAVCRDFEQEADALAPPAGKADIARYVDQALPIFDSGLQRLRALKVASTIDQAVDEWLRSMTASRDLLEDLGAAAAAKDDARFLDLDAQHYGLDDHADRLGRNLGLTDCVDD